MADEQGDNFPKRDPHKPRGNDERDDRFPYGGERTERAEEDRGHGPWQDTAPYNGEWHEVDRDDPSRTPEAPRPDQRPSHDEGSATDGD